MSPKTTENDCPAQDKVVLALLAFITPIIGGIFLPWWSVVMLILSMIFAIAIIALAGYPEIAKRLPAPLFMLIIGFGFQLWGEVSGFLGFCVGLFILLFSGVHLMFWTDFLGLDERHSKRSYAMRFQGAANVLDVTSRTDYLANGEMAWLANDARGSMQLQAGVDRWSLLSAQAVIATSPVIEQPAITNEMDQGRRCQGEVDAGGRLIFNAPQGRHRLHGEPLMPTDMPGDPAYSLWLDDKPTGLLLERDASVLWSDDDQALVCRARVESQSVGETATWLWQMASGWRPLDEPWQNLADEPPLEWGAPDRLDADRLVYEARLRDQVVGQPSAEARLLSLCIELAGAVSLQLPAMQGGVQPCLSMLHKSLDGRRHVFACHIGAWTLPGQWCLDHRISDCGRYLALIAFVEAPAAGHQLVIADVLARRLLMLDEALLIAALGTFDEGVINLLRITDRQAGAAVEALPPAADQTERFIAETVRVAVDAWSLRLLPNWRLECRPVPACAQGDYLLPAPCGRDAAWLFGLTKATDQAPGGGCVLTVSGCGVANLAPSMVWSADGRYLALSRKSVEEEAGERSPQWFLLLLDTRERTLRQSAQPLGHMPCLEAFDDAGLHLSSATQKTQLITMQALLALPRQMLIRSGDIWLPSEQLSDAVHWQRLDSDHLQSWRVSDAAESRA